MRIVGLRDAIFTYPSTGLWPNGIGGGEVGENGRWKGSGVDCGDDPCQAVLFAIDSRPRMPSTYPARIVKQQAPNHKQIQNSNDRRSFWASDSRLRRQSYLGGAGGAFEAGSDSCSSIWQLGRAAFSLATPAGVTFVPGTSRRVRFFRAER